MSEIEAWREPERYELYMTQLAYNEQMKRASKIKEPRMVEDIEGFNRRPEDLKGMLAYCHRYADHIYIRANVEGTWRPIRLSELPPEEWGRNMATYIQSFVLLEIVPMINRPTEEAPPPYSMHIPSEENTTYHNCIQCERIIQVMPKAGLITLDNYTFCSECMNVGGFYCNECRTEIILHKDTPRKGKLICVSCLRGEDKQ